MRLLNLPHALLACAALWALPAGAQVFGEDPGGARPIASALGPAIGEPVLEGLRGGAASTASDMQLSATTASNTAYQMSTGDNAIGSGAFSGMSGIPMVIQNTGANVLIQNAVILNLQIN